ncbi:MAG TPA: Hpt domain-containing protein [Rhodanobacteraceae bacterium]|nr:Hpt domain-containing protein [Rhodanobacteraceae bacterium]
MGDDLAEAEFDARYRLLQSQYLSELPQRRKAVAASWAASMRDAASPAWRELHSLAHRLSGSAPCYGLDAVGEAAQEVDRLLSAKPPCRELPVLRPVVSRLLNLLDAAIAASRPKSGPS